MAKENSKPNIENRVSSIEHRIIPLTSGKFAIVDAEDYDRLSRHKWYAARHNGHFYAQRQQGGKTIMMHREILNIPQGLLCDHKNHDTLNNRKSNLRTCTPAQNQYNQLPRTGGTSCYKGVHWHRDHRRWEAQITYRGLQIHIGYYAYEQDAAIAYDDMAIELFGEFACLNCNYRPEIRQWLDQTYFFKPTNAVRHPSAENIEHQESTPFNVQSSKFNVQRSPPFGVPNGTMESLWTTFNVQRPTSNVQRSSAEESSTQWIKPKN